MRQSLVSAGLYVLGMVMVTGAVAVSVAASISRVPEIDGSLIPAGLAVLAGGVLFLRARRRSK